MFPPSPEGLGASSPLFPPSPEGLGASSPLFPPSPEGLGASPLDGFAASVEGCFGAMYDGAAITRAIRI